MKYIYHFILVALSLVYSLSAFADDTHLDPVLAGGIGGNAKIGRYVFGGLNYPSLEVMRDSKTGVCYFANRYVTEDFYLEGKKTITFPCQSIEPTHQTYWNGEFYPYNSAYSPANDAFYAGTVVSKMFEAWYGLPVIHDEQNKPLQVKIHNYGGGIRCGNEKHHICPCTACEGNYPMTSISWIAYDMAKLFDEQHANFKGVFKPQNEAMAIREAFAFMTAVAANYFATNVVDWRPGLDTSANGLPMYYLDQPSLDCKGGNTPGHDCAMDSASQVCVKEKPRACWFNPEGYNQCGCPIYMAGVYTRAFYLLATTQGWGVKKAYDLMVQAEKYYWRSDTNFLQGACGVVSAARDYKYNTDDVARAFKQVAIDVSQCK